MTRSTIRLAQILAAAITAGILAAALAQSTRAGLGYTARLLTVVGLCGAVASLGWHGMAAVIERHEERKRAERRHRVPRADHGALRPPAAAAPASEASPGYAPALDAEVPRDPQVEQAFADFAQSIDPYLKPPAARWMSATEAAQYEDLYAHHTPSGT